MVLNDDRVSRQHARIVFAASKWIIRDLGSRNGVFVNRRRISEHELSEEDKVVIGGTRLRFHLRE